MFIMLLGIVGLICFLIYSFITVIMIVLKNVL